MGRKRTVGWGYERAGVVQMEEVLPLILDSSVQKTTFCGHRVNVTSLRLQTFATKGLSCSNCGLVATHFAVEAHTNQQDWHLNLWADRTSEGKGEMLMTHDHTLARSLGGVDNLSNVTTMCSKCNFQKSIGERQEANKRKQLTAPIEEKTVDEVKLPGEIGSRIKKKSKSKFKCGEHIATIAAICSSLMDPKRRLAYVVAEDDSVVCAYQCIVLPD